MKAAVVESFGSLVVREVPEPKPGDYDALCELVYGATCTGTDTHLLRGDAPFRNWVKLPFILGHESVGRVVRVGAKVRHFRVGDLVTRVGAPGGGGVNIGWGGYAEFGLARDHWAMCADGLPQSEWSGHRVNQVVPTGVDERVAPMFTTWRETLSYMTRMGVGSGASLLVVGSGGNGLAYAAHAVNLGCSAVAMAGAAYLESTTRAKAKVTAYVDYRRADLAEALKQAVPGGFDFIIDAVGKSGVADRVLPCIKPGGKYGTYGIDESGGIRLNPSAAPGGFVVHPTVYDEAETHQRVSEFLLQGRLDATLWYDPAQAFPLTAINEAFAHVWARKSPKALVCLRGDGL